MNLFIRVVDGVPVDHPILEDNLLMVYNLTSITDTFLADHGFARFERVDVPVGYEFIEHTGYEMGTDGVVRNAFRARELTQEEKVELWIRRQRNYLLALSDWTQLADSPLSDEEKEEWKTYRQELRDLTDTYADVTDPTQIVFPQSP